MKTLSLIQPWASLIMLGLKRYETRSWSTAYRGPILIHASGTRDRDGRNLWENLIADPLPPGFKVPTVPKRYADLPFGAVLCRAVLTEVIPTTHFSLLPGVEGFLGDFSPGRYAWRLTEVERIWPHQTAKGSLGLWEFDLPEVVR